MRFINIHSCKLLFSVGSHDEAITTAAVSPSGRHVVAIMDNGSINVYCVQNLTQELNKVQQRMRWLDPSNKNMVLNVCISPLSSPSRLPPWWP